MMNLPNLFPHILSKTSFIIIYPTIFFYPLLITNFYILELPLSLFYKNLLHLLCISSSTSLTFHHPTLSHHRLYYYFTFTHSPSPPQKNFFTLVSSKNFLTFVTNSIITIINFCILSNKY